MARLDVIGDIEQLRASASTCRACPLWEHATQTVFGEGPTNSDLVLVGEQPGDKEDLAGKPFVGPAGMLLRDSLIKADISIESAYVTNAVKHFKWEAKGSRRIHQRPNNREVAACYPWLRAELEAIRPKLIVLLGATAAQAIHGKDFRVTRQRGEFLRCEAGFMTMATIHPSALLRVTDHEEKEIEIAKFIADLQAAKEYLAEK